jgi:hypothetical protein
MSYTQIATACGFSGSTAIRAAKAARDRWLRIEVGKGRYTPGKGCENLYHGIIPAEWLAELHRRRSQGRAVSTDVTIAQAADIIAADLATGAARYGVSDSHPEIDRGVPQTQPGRLSDTLTLYNSLEEIGATAPTVEVSGRHPEVCSERSGTTKAEALLDPEKAYAERNITVSPSGKLTIGDEFRAELLADFTAEQIEGGVDCTLAAMGTVRDKVRIAQQVRRQCTFKRENDRKQAAVPRRPGIVRNGRPSM